MWVTAGLAAPTDDEKRAHEPPEIFVQEVRTAFKPLRQKLLGTEGVAVPASSLRRSPGNLKSLTTTTPGEMSWPK